MATQLTKDQTYDTTAIKLVGWTEGDGSGHEGYNVGDYFAADGSYLGADEHGIEPIVESLVSLQDFNNDVKAVTYLWICGVACPAGQSFSHNVEADGEDYCDVNELIGEMGLWELKGTVVDGQWKWNGEGNVRDERGNTIYNVEAH